MTEKNEYVAWFEKLGSNDTPLVGGKNASLGEMIRVLKGEGISVPEGFATTADAYWTFIKENDLEAGIREQLEQLENGEKPLEQVGQSIRRLFLKASFPEAVSTAVTKAYRELSQRYEAKEVDVAVRSSATAEDLPEASFAGQQETFLNIVGEHELMDACRKCFASLFTDRAMSYRRENGFDHMKVALSVGVQKMVRADKAAAGVMFSIDTETGFPDLVVINGAWGLGENVVQGTVTPDEFLVFKPLLENRDLVPIIGKSLGAKEKKIIYAGGGSQTTKNVDTPKKDRSRFTLTDKQIIQLARWAVVIEKHYQTPMDIEWAEDGNSGRLFIVQARPETVQSQKQADSLKTYTLKNKSERLVTGLSIGEAIAAAPVCKIKSTEEIDQFQKDTILVTEMTDPDWVPIMKKAAGIVTDHGGRTCHAAIVSRELGIPAIVGTGNATEILDNDDEVTISCAEGDKGYVYQGILNFEEDEVPLDDIPATRTKIMMNVASPDAAFRWWRLPCEGIGLARMEFIINNIIKIHPLALTDFDQLEDKDVQRTIRELTRQYEDKTAYFVDHLSRGIAKIAAAQYPDPVIVRMSDFKTSEYADLIGGKLFETTESNPMLGFRGASRYYSDRYRRGFDLECRAIKHVREGIGLTNVRIMVPFCRTIEEADRVLEVLAENGLKQAKNNLEIYVMAEIPANIILAEQFADRFDGFSIGSNDLTQLVLGVDRDSSQLAHLFDEKNEAVKRQISHLIRAAHEKNRKVGICGQAPSDHADFAVFLVEQGIDSISLNPDSVIRVKKRIAQAEQKKMN